MQNRVEQFLTSHSLHSNFDEFNLFPTSFLLSPHTSCVCSKKKWRSLLKYGCDNFARAFTLTSTEWCRVYECARERTAATHESMWSWRRCSRTDKNDVSFAIAFDTWPVETQTHRHKTRIRFEIACILQKFNIPSQNQIARERLEFIKLIWNSCKVRDF